MTALVKDGEIWACAERGFDCPRLKIHGWEPFTGRGGRSAFLNWTGELAVACTRWLRYSPWAGRFLPSK